jgi:hypothetical protein
MNHGATPRGVALILLGRSTASPGTLPPEKGHAMRKPAKTIPVIRWADGSTSIVHKGKPGWWFHVPGDAGGEHGTDSMWGVKDTAAAHGGKVERIPNPDYAAQLRAWENSELRRMFRPFFDF